MYERKRLEESRYFFNRMMVEYGNSETFTYNLSAFLCLSRSILQYAYEEVKDRRDELKWYDEWVNRSTIISYFREKRNEDIHEEPIKPTQNITVTLSPGLGLGLSVSVIGSPSGSYEKPPLVNNQPPEIRVRYMFSDWLGGEDIMTLCKMYLDQLQQFVDDGTNKGFITG